MVSQAWNSLISRLPNPHFLQTYEWGQVKAKYGWSPIYIIWDEAGKMEEVKSLSSFDFHPLAAALVLKRTIPIAGMSARLSIFYMPKGPLLDWTSESLRNRVLNDLQAFAKKQGAIFLKIDPDVVSGTGVPGAGNGATDGLGQTVMSELKKRGWGYSSDQIQFKNTILIDLEPSEEELLKRMKQKTRYNIRLAEKKGVTLRAGKLEDMSMLYKMYAETSVRDGFVIRDEEYYKTVWQIFMANAHSLVSSIQSTPNSQFTNHQSTNHQSTKHQSTNHQSTNYQLPSAEPLIAEVNHEPIAAIFIFYFAGRAYYVYGMSRDIHREKMPGYLLQWEAIKRARARGCTVYDLWGAPDVFSESDSMWGVYRFKEGLGGQVVRTLGAWDFAPNPFWYKLYSETIPRLLDIMRSRGKTKTRQSLGGA